MFNFTKSSFRCWIIFGIVIATCYAEIRCPTEQNCNCYLSPEGVFEIQCPTDNYSAFTVKVKSHERIGIECVNFPKWIDFPTNVLPPENVTLLYFKMCELPINQSLSEISNKLGAQNVEKLIFHSYGKISVLNRKHLQGFPNLEYLSLTCNNLTNFSNDTFADIPRLKNLNLRQNNIYSLSGIFNYIPYLEILELGDNKLKEIDANTFEPLKALKMLNMWGNKFTEFKSNIFDKLVSLNSLDVSSNYLNTLPNDIFAKLVNLELLNLAWNNFSSLPEGLLQHNIKLNKVQLYNNRISMETLPNGLFANLKNLKEIELKNNGLIKLPDLLFHDSISLDIIDLSSNNLESLPEYLFTNLINLTKLILNRNKLTSLPNSIFSQLKKLITLDLSSNNLTSISRHLFNNLISLQNLNMEKNQLKIIEETSFNFLTKLRIAKFSDNQLTFNTSINSYIDEYGRRSPFQSCSSLEELYLDKNNISDIFGDWLVTHVKLKKLNLQFNQISEISIRDLQFVSNSIEVNLTNNKIKHINLSEAKEIAGFQQDSRDVMIYIENNPIECDCDIFDFLLYLEGKLGPNVYKYFHIMPGCLTCQSPQTFKGKEIVKLESKKFICQISDPCPNECTCYSQQSNKEFTLNCSQRNLTSVPRNIETLLNYKLVINLTDNKLSEMPSLTEIGLDNIQISKLLLSNNDIHEISVDGLQSNIELELHNNNISKLEPNVLQFLNNSPSLTLHGNPWICDCDTKDLLSFIQTKISDIRNSSLITCKDMDISMIKMTAADFCPTYTALIVSLSFSLAVSGMIIGLLAAIYYRYQREIKVWLYAHQFCLWLITEDELDKDKLYDAFISYSHKDEDFVVNELVSKLENGPKPFKLCLHFRDWLAGEWIPTQIARSVEESRRTIVVLSPNFLESVWGRMEFRVAHCQALSERRSKVILILYDEIGPINNLDPELKAYMSMNTYVKWGDPWFWDKLRYALPHTEFTKNVIRKKIFQKHQPCIQIKGEKKELIYPIDTPETPPATNTPPADTLKTFICDKKDSDNKENSQNLSSSDCNTKLILSTEELVKHNLVNKVQCTTV